MAEHERRSRSAAGRFVAGAAERTGDGTVSIRQIQQVRRKRPTRFTAAGRRMFLDTLAATLNIRLSAETAGISSQSVYHHRRVDAQFRAEWQTALDEGYVRLEAELLDRALNGKRKQVARGGQIVETIEFSDSLALNLLLQHRKAVAEYRAALPPPGEDVAVLRARFIAKLAGIMEAMPDKPRAGLPALDAPAVA